MMNQYQPTYKSLVVHLYEILNLILNPNNYNSLVYFLFDWARIISGTKTKLKTPLRIHKHRAGEVEFPLKFTRNIQKGINICMYTKWFILVNALILRSHRSIPSNGFQPRSTFFSWTVAFFRILRARNQFRMIQKNNSTYAREDYPSVKNSSIKFSTK